MSKVTQKQIVFEVMPRAVSDAGSYAHEPIISTRDLYYAVRTLYLAHPHRPLHKDRLEYHYFSTALLTAYQEHYGPIPGLVRDPRGHLYEPHTGTTMELGTLSVAEYDFPPFWFDKILYVEKEGELPKLMASRLAERYDMALVTGKGYPTEAIRVLFSRAEKDVDYQLFVFHDADPDGYSIARVISEETRRMPDHGVEVHDIGLFVEDAEEMGLQSDTFTRQKALPEKLVTGLNSRELELFTGEQTGSRTWRDCIRYELNALLPASRRTDYIEEKLRQNGVRPKVIPPEGELGNRTRQRYKNELDYTVDRALEEMISLDNLKNEVAAELEELFSLNDARSWIEEGFEKDDSRSWRSVVDRHIESRILDIEDRLGESVREKVRRELNGL